MDETLDHALNQAINGWIYSVTNEKCNKMRESTNNNQQSQTIG
jgi:hypothetical protein